MKKVGRNINPKSLENLRDSRAADLQGERCGFVGAYIGAEDREWLRSIAAEQGVSFHVRQAIRQYRRFLESQNSSQL